MNIHASTRALAGLCRPSLIADAYRELLKDVTPDQLEAWASEWHWIGSALKNKRVESVFYRDAVVILLGFLVSANQTGVPRHWPVDAAYLEDFYTTLGISTSGLF
jgi:hypothetical protein